MTAGRDDPVALTPPPAGPRKRSPVLLVVGAIGLVGAGYIGWNRISYSKSHVTTDNAQVDGHITPIAPRVPAFVDRVMVEENQRVAAGDTLVVLSDNDYRARLDQARADLRSVEATIGTRARIGQAAATRNVTEATAAGAQGSVTAAQAALRKATADYQRYQTLAAQNIIPAQQLDQAQWAVDNAKATLESAERMAAGAVSQTDVATAGIRIAEARLAAARAAVTSAELQLGNTVILAPVGGVIAKRAVEPGALVAIGQPLLSIVPESGIWVTANLKETQLAEVAIGNEVEITVDAYPGTSIHGKVASLSPATGARFALLPPDNATGNFTKVVQRIPVKIELTGPNDRIHPLRPGMSVDVAITVR